MPSVQDLEIDVENKCVYQRGKEVVLPRLSYDLLVFLSINEGKTCSVDEIAKAVWQDSVVSDETVVQRIKLLRQSLQDDPKHPQYIESVRGYGYRFIKQNKSNSKRKVIVLASCALFVVALCSLFLLSIQHREAESEVAKTEDTLISRAQYYHDIGQEDDLNRAVQLYRNSLREKPDNEKALIGLSQSLSALVCRYHHPSSLAEEAKQYADRVLQQNPQHARAWGALGFAWDCLGNLVKAKDSYVRAVELDPEQTNSKSAAAHLLEKQGLLVQALKWNLEVRSKRERSEYTDLQIARILELLGFRHRAEQIYRYLFSLYPDNVFINESLAWFYFKSGQMQSTTEVLTEVEQRGVERSSLSLLKAELALMNNDHQTMATELTSALQINPNTSIALTIEQALLQQPSIEWAENKLRNLRGVIGEGDTWPGNYLEIFVVQYYVLNDSAAALDTLYLLMDSGFLEIGYLQHSPLFEPIRQKKAFRDFVEALLKKRETMKNQVLEASWLPANLLNEQHPWAQMPR